MPQWWSGRKLELDLVVKELADRMGREHTLPSYDAVDDFLDDRANLERVSRIRQEVTFGDIKLKGLPPAERGMNFKKYTDLFVRAVLIEQVEKCHLASPAKSSAS